MGEVLSEAMLWMQSGLDVRYDDGFRSALAEARGEDGGFERLLEASEYAQAQYDNMDF